MDQFFFACITQVRTSINIGFLDRPLTLGLLLGLVSGEWNLCLGVGLFFELLWLDLFPAGTFIPPQRVLSTLLVLGVAFALDLSSVSSLLVPLLCALPAASVGVSLEERLRLWQNNNYTRILDWAEQKPRSVFPKQIIWHAVTVKFVSEFAAFALLVALATALTTLIQSMWPQPGMDLEWPHLWSLALIGAILSVRIRRAYELLLIGGVLCSILVALI